MIEELQALYEQATAGEWIPEEDAVLGQFPDGNWPILLTDDCIDVERDEANAAWIAESHNAWPSIYALLRDAREELAEIARGAGAFDLDELTHAGNCIDDMKARAAALLARLGEPSKEAE